MVNRFTNYNYIGFSEKKQEGKEKNQ